MRRVAWRDDGGGGREGVNRNGSGNGGGHWGRHLPLETTPLLCFQLDNIRHLAVAC